MIAGIAGLLTVAGTGLSVFGQFKQAQAAENAEKIRKKGMSIEAARARREQIRRAQVARATATASATVMGAQQTSALAGGQAQVTQESNRNIQAINEDQGLGKALFKQNKNYAQGGMIASAGQGLSNLGGAVSNSSGFLTKIGIG